MTTNAELDSIILKQEEQRGAVLLSRVSTFLGRFIAFPNEHAQVAVALWIFHTHLMDRWESTARLALLSPEPASGKTRTLEVAELLVPRPIKPVNASPSYLFTCVASDDGPATVLYDEIDTVFGS